MEYFCRHGPGDVQGQRIHHGDEYFAFVLDCYALGEDPHNAHMLYDSVFFSRPKVWPPLPRGGGGQAWQRLR